MAQREEPGGDRVPDDDALVLLVALHVVVGVVSDGEDVWRHLANLLVFVSLDLLSCVDGQHLIWVDGHQDGSSEGLQWTK